MQHLDSLRRNRLINVTLDEASIGRGSPDQEHERAIAIYDLIEDNAFALPGHAGGPVPAAHRAARSPSSR